MQPSPSPNAGTPSRNQLVEKMHDQAKSAKRLMTLSDSTKKLAGRLQGGKSTPSPMERSLTKQLGELQDTMLAAQEQVLYTAIEPKMPLPPGRESSRLRSNILFVSLPASAILCQRVSQGLLGLQPRIFPPRVLSASVGTFCA